MSLSLPPYFAWGAAASSYQIEGAVEMDGAGPSVWDMFCQMPDKVFEGHTGAVACDHFHRYAEDVALMRQIGLPHYRLSICWPRVLAQGSGAVNEKGLAFYDRLVDSLLEAGVQPWVTLFHWDYPLALYRRGGWLNPESPKWFSDYTAVVVDRLSDRVSHWMTFNEPQCFVGLGHQLGYHAPGDKLELSEALRVSHHVLLSHGLATQVIRARAVTSPQIGLAMASIVAIPADKTNPADIAAARQSMFAINPQNPLSWDGVPLGNNTWWSDPVFLGRYPQDGLETFGSAVPKFTNADLQTIAQPVDFCGINIYNGTVIRSRSDGTAEKVPQPPGSPMSALKWPITPNALYWGPKFFFERYRHPVIITENGLSLNDWVSSDGHVHDPQRIDFLRSHLREMTRAIRDGTEVSGYFHWSLMDNFEWAHGYKERFGLIYVDYETQKRTLKDSAYWYRDLIRSNGASLAE
jgi:beta-glucosidase